MVEAVPIVLQWPTDGAEAATMSMNSFVVDLAGRVSWRAFQTTVPEPERLPLPPAIEHRAAGQHDRRHVDRGCRHQAGRRGLVAAGHQHHAVERIAVQHLDEAEIGEVAVERRGRPLAGLLNRMHRELEGDAAGVADALAHALGELEMVAIAGREIGAGLGDADDRLARGQFLARQPVIEIALEIERGHAGIVGIVEPGIASAGVAPCDVTLAIAVRPSSHPGRLRAAIAFGAQFLALKSPREINGARILPNG